MVPEHEGTTNQTDDQKEDSKGTTAQVKREKREGEGEKEAGHHGSLQCRMRLGRNQEFFYIERIILFPYNVQLFNRLNFI